MPLIVVERLFQRTFTISFGLGRSALFFAVMASSVLLVKAMASGIAAPGTIVGGGTFYGSNPGGHKLIGSLAEASAEGEVEYLWYYRSRAMGAEAWGRWTRWRPGPSVDHWDYTGTWSHQFKRGARLKNRKEWAFSNQITFDVRAQQVHELDAADPADVLLEEGHLDGERQCPPDYLRIYVSHRGVNTTVHVNDPQKPVRDLWYARRLIDRVEAYDKEHGLNRYPGYCILLKRGETFTPSRYYELDVEKQQTFDTERNRAAFYWDYNKPLILTSYGATGGRPILNGQTGTIRKTNGFGVPQQTVKVQIAVHICNPRESPNRQKTLIENIHFKGWEMSAIWCLMTKQVEIRNNIIEEIGTYFHPDESYTAKEFGRKIGGAPRENGWPIYAGGAVYAHRSSDVAVRNNVFKHIHNADREDFPLVDKLHVIYILYASDTVFENNLVSDVSGPLAIKGSWRSVIRGNRFERMSPMANDVHDFSGGSYVQLGFLRIPSVKFPDDAPRKLRVEGNIFDAPFSWDRMLERPTRPGLSGTKMSGNFVSGVRGYLDDVSGIFYDTKTLCYSCWDGTLEDEIQQDVTINGVTQSRLAWCLENTFVDNIWNLTPMAGPLGRGGEGPEK